MRPKEVEKYEKKIEELVKKEIVVQKKQFPFLGKIFYHWQREGSFEKKNYLSEINIQIENKPESIDTYLIFFKNKRWYKTLKNLKKDIRTTFLEWVEEYKKKV